MVQSGQLGGRGVLRLTHGRPWHTLYITETGADPPTVLVESTTTPPPPPFDIPGNVEAVLVLSELGSQEPAISVVRALGVLEVALPPVIVVLLLPGPRAVEHEVVLAAQRALGSIGADDTIVHAASGPEDRKKLRRAVKMSLQQLAGRRAAAAEQHAERMWARQREPARDDMFWRCVHQVFKGFPAMRTDIGVAPALGAHIGDHLITSCIGQGGYGKVYAALNRRTGCAEAVKVVRKDQLTEFAYVCSMWNEFKLMSKIQHKHIVGFRSLGHLADHLYICMELVGPRNLYQEIRAVGGRLNPARAQAYEAQVVDAVAYLHRQGLAHRDLKPENIAVCDRGRVLKLLDFGAVVALGKMCTDVSGTLIYMAPEIIGRKAYDPAAGDVWACGVLLFEMHCGVDKLMELFHWNQSSPTSSVQMAADVGEFFTWPFYDMLDCLEAYLGVVEDDLLDVFAGTLEIAPTSRWTSAQLAKCRWIEMAYCPW